MNRYEERFYRDWTRRRGLVTWRTAVAESDLQISCDRRLADESLEALLALRRDLEGWIAGHADFLTSLSPVEVPFTAPLMVREMSSAASQWHVGPMAAVAGAVAEVVARALLECSAESVIVENGGDIFALAPEPVRFGLYAGEDSPFSSRFAFDLDVSDGAGVCTSSRKVGPSLSFGNADAVVAIARTGALADAAATSVANRIAGPEHVAPVLESEHRRGGLSGLIACAGGSIGLFGDFGLVLRGEEEECLRRA